MAGQTDSMSARAGGKRSETKRRWGLRKKLPGELAEFRLEDGQFLGDVLGDDFFGPVNVSMGGKPLSERERQRIRAGNYPLGGNEGNERVFGPRADVESTPPARATALETRNSRSLPPQSVSMEKKNGGSSASNRPDDEDAMSWLDNPGSSPPLEYSRNPDVPEYVIPGQAAFHDGDTNALERIAGAATLAVSDLFKEPLGIAHEDLGPLVNQSREDYYTPLFGTVRTFNEVLLEGGSQALDLGLRSVAATILGGAAAAGQVLVELGASKTTARQVMRDLVAAVDSQMGSPTRGGTALANAARKGKSVGHFRPVETTLLFDDAERSGALAQFLNKFPPERRAELREALRKAYVGGQEVAEAEMRRHGPRKALLNPAGAVAERRLKKFEDQWDDRTEPINTDRIFGSTFNDFPPYLQSHLKRATNNAMGAAAQRHAFDLARKMDAAAESEVAVNTHPQIRQNRRFDYIARRWSTQVREEAFGLYRALFGRRGAGYASLPEHGEVKSGGGDLSVPQRLNDATLRANPGVFGDPPVHAINYSRIFDYQIPLKKAFPVMESRLETQVKRGRIDEATKEALLSAMISMREGGRKTITLADYADLYTKFVPAAAAHAKSDNGIITSIETD